MRTTTSSQYEALLQFMEHNGDISLPQLKESGLPANGRIHYHQQWIELTNILNSVPDGSEHKAEKWRKVWSDLKSNTKKKAKTIKYTPGTSRAQFTDLEFRVLQFVGYQETNSKNNQRREEQQPVCEILKVSPKMPLTQAEKSKRYREKLKITNPKKYEETMRKNKERAIRAYYMKVNSMTEAQKQEMRLKWRQQNKSIKKTRQQALTVPIERSAESNTNRRLNQHNQVSGSESPEDCSRENTPLPEHEIFYPNTNGDRLPSLKYEPVTEKNTQVKEEDEFDVFVKNVALQLKKLPLAYALETQEMIQRILKEQRIRAMEDSQAQKRTLVVKKRYAHKLPDTRNFRETQDPSSNRNLVVFVSESDPLLEESIKPQLDDDD